LSINSASNSPLSSKILALPFYTIAYQENPPLLRGSNPRTLSPVEITETCELLLATAEKHQCPYWLLDGRANAQHQPVELHEWMRDEYFPRVRATLGQRPHVAFLVAPEVWQGLNERGYEAPQDWTSFALHAGWFTEEPLAVAWLQLQR
jgi:hypothetical protein